MFSDGESDLYLAEFPVLCQPEAPLLRMPQELLPRCRGSPAPSAAHRARPGDSRSRRSKHTAPGWGKHLLQSLTRAHITVRQDSRADGNNGSCFGHSFFKQQAAPRGYLCGEQKTKQNKNKNQKPSVLCYLDGQRDFRTKNI